MEVSIMSLIIRKKMFKGNALAALLGSVSLSAIFGTILYHAVGWQQSTLLSAALFIIATITTYLLAHELPTHHENRNKKFWLFNAIIFAETLACFWYAFHRTANDWIGSPWQAVSYKFIPALFFVITTTALAIIYKKISARIFFFVLLLLLSINTIIFNRGFGFDIFVHTATVNAWLSHGTIAPISILYNGFHAIIAALASITRLPVLDLISWTTPFIGATVLGAIFARMRGNEKMPFVIAGFFLIFNSLFTTSTPQALGHFLLFGFMIELWQRAEIISTKDNILHALIALGIATIHPLSGIPAILFFLWSLKPRNIIFALATIFGPALALIVGAHGKFAFENFSIRELFIPTIAAFQPNILTSLSYSAALLAPLILFTFAIIGYKNNRNEQNIFLFSLLLIASGIITRAVHIENIIGYEQSAFASRIILAGYFFMIPLAATGAQKIWNSISSRTARVIVGASTITALCGIWFIAYPAWNSVQKTKAINTSETDFQITKKIDRGANGKPYIVLADQPTSAAALATFGFFDHQLPSRDYYFYPIPTGGELYTKFFLPAMYKGVTPEILKNAAIFANVSDVYIVIKPYWTNAEKNTEAIKNSSLEYFDIGETTVAHLHLK
jgi:hypothetical protein